MTCKDCIHENVCVMIAFPEAFENTKWGKDPCDHFKNKAGFVEVVKCKDCLFCLENYNHEYLCSAMTNPNYVSIDHFCSYGERKNDFKE